MSHTYKRNAFAFLETRASKPCKSLYNIRNKLNANVRSPRVDCAKTSLHKRPSLRRASSTPFGTDASVYPEAKKARRICNSTSPRHCSYSASVLRGKLSGRSAGNFSFILVSPRIDPRGERW
ncbi:hypothetical protein MRX96_024445 [Rhipicephalus microplus]